MTEALIDFPTIEAAPMPAAITEVLDAAPAAKHETAIALVRRTTLAELTAVERGIAKLKADHGATDYDITTPKGLQLAKDRRMAVREVRYQIPHTVKARKAELKEVGEALDSEAERITAELLKIETPHDEKIKAREKTLADEKAERERIAAERQQKQTEGIARIRGYLSRAQTAADMTADRVALGIAGLVSMEFTAADWLDPVAAADAQCQTVEAMRQLHGTLLAREAEAARLEAQRVENERVAAEQAARQAELDRQAAEHRASMERIAGLNRQIEEIRAAASGFDNAAHPVIREAALQVALLDVSEDRFAELAPLAQAAQAATIAALDKLHDAALARAEAKRAADKAAAEAPAPTPQEYPEGQDSQQVLKAEGASPDATDRDAPADASPRVGAMGAGQAADAAPAAERLLLQDECKGLSVALASKPDAPMHAREAAAAIEVEPTLMLGTINERIAPLSITGAGLSLLGFEPAGRRKSAALFNESDWPAMRAAMVKSLEQAA